MIDTFYVLLSGIAGLGLGTGATWSYLRRDKEGEPWPTLVELKETQASLAELGKAVMATRVMQSGVKAAAAQFGEQVTGQFSDLALKAVDLDKLVSGTVGAANENAALAGELKPKLYGVVSELSHHQSSIASAQRDHALFVSEVGEALASIRNEQDARAHVALQDAARRELKAAEDQEKHTAKYLAMIEGWAGLTKQRFDEVKSVGEHAIASIHDEAEARLRSQAMAASEHVKDVAHVSEDMMATVRSKFAKSVAPLEPEKTGVVTIQYLDGQGQIVGQETIPAAMRRSSRAFAGGHFTASDFDGNAKLWIYRSAT